MKKLLIVLSMLLVGIQMKGETKYYPVGTTWTEVSRYAWWEEWDTTTYIVKDEVLLDGVAYNEVLANGSRYCLIREEGPLVYIWLDKDHNGLLYDFNWWEGKNYVACKFGSYEFSEVISKIEERLLEDGESYQIWAPELMCGDYIICGVGGTNSILKYYYPAITGGGETHLLEFVRDVKVFNYNNGINGLEEIGAGNFQEHSRPIRLRRNSSGGFVLQVHNTDGTWKMIK